MRFLLFGLVFTETLLLAGLTLEMVLVPAQAVLLLPGFWPTFIEQREPQCQHGIDMLGFPMHARPFQTSLHDELVATLPTPDTARANRPALLSVGRIVHQLTPLLQVGHLLLDLWIAPDQASDMQEHTRWCRLSDKK